MTESTIRVKLLEFSARKMRRLRFGSSTGLTAAYLNGYTGVYEPAGAMTQQGFNEDEDGKVISMMKTLEENEEESVEWYEREDR